MSLPPDGNDEASIEARSERAAWEASRGGDENAWNRAWKAGWNGGRASAGAKLAEHRGHDLTVEVRDDTANLMCKTCQVGVFPV